MKKKVFRERYEEPEIIEVKIKPVKMKKGTDSIEYKDIEDIYELKPKKTTKKKVGK